MANIQHSIYCGRPGPRPVSDTSGVRVRWEWSPWVPHRTERRHCLASTGARGRRIMQVSPLSIPWQSRPLPICKRPSDTSRLESVASGSLRAERQRSCSISLPIPTEGSAAGECRLMIQRQGFRSWAQYAWATEFTVVQMSTEEAHTQRQTQDGEQCTGRFD